MWLPLECSISHAQRRERATKITLARYQIAQTWLLKTWPPYIFFSVVRSRSSIHLTISTSAIWLNSTSLRSDKWSNITNLISSKSAYKSTGQSYLSPPGPKKNQHICTINPIPNSKFILFSFCNFVPIISFHFSNLDSCSTNSRWSFLNGAWQWYVGGINFDNKTCCRAWYAIRYQTRR